MPRCILYLMALLAFASMALGQYDIGPASFAWPPPRLWNRTVDNIPPCGSLDGSGNRTKFPLDHGYVSFVAQEESRNVELSVSFLLDPRSVADFTPFMKTEPLRKLGVGITCIDVPNPPSWVGVGDKATLQLRVSSDFDSPVTQVYFACADITFVDPSDILFPQPCVNLTAEEPDSTSRPTTTAKKPKGKPTKEPKPTGDGWPPGKRPGLSKAAIAGIGISGVIPLTGIVVGFCFIRNKRKERRIAAEREQEEAEWVAQIVPKQAPGIQLQNLSHSAQR
ncbi:wsc2 glucoamylase iii alpha-1,4-glucan-glucosidase [Trichoderma arundinaceum]|uniref:Wsc2 glucoamylase iii alpha-1,4-glucan-glucosidase n=1 Tax=Trichoderma arundinaceum TaxID=490622 RepID=A0A395NYV3_TRIAR|nr:wsc2 glucoamylase iii alpha-1,4-glucan-glucosidase [Trichoderma arundinaceum]